MRQVLLRYTSKPTYKAYVLLIWFKVLKLENQGEIAIIGAGPVGCYTALTLAKLGIAEKVTVFEEHEEVGVPSHCAGHLSLKSLKNLNIELPPKIIENKIRGAVIYSPNNLKLELITPKTITIVVNRALFDKFLAEKAEKLGVKLYVKSKVKALLANKNKIHGVIIAEKGKERKIMSKLVIDAEGSPGTLLKKASLPSPLSSKFVYGAQAEISNVKDLAEDQVEVYLGSKYAPGFFAWIIPRKNNTAKVGLAVKNGNPKEYLFKFIQKHPIASKKLNRGKISKLAFHPIPLGGPISKTYWNNLLVVGDAASQVKPTTGGGVIFGMLCGRIAARVAYKAWKIQDFSENLLGEYERLWKARLGLNFEIMLYLRKLLDRMSDSQVDKLFKVTSKTGLVERLKNVEDVDFQAKILLNVLRNPKNFPPILYFFLAGLLGEGTRPTIDR